MYEINFSSVPSLKPVLSHIASDWKLGGFLLGHVIVNWYTVIYLSPYLGSLYLLVDWEVTILGHHYWPWHQYCVLELNDLYWICSVFLTISRFPLIRGSSYSKSSKFSCTSGMANLFPNCVTIAISVLSVCMRDHYQNATYSASNSLF